MKTGWMRMARILVPLMLVVASGCAGLRQGGRASAELTGTRIGPETDQAPVSLDDAVTEPAVTPAGKLSRGWGHVALWYLPNRLFDLLDIVRFRVRAGPGFAVNARITAYADAYIGSYNTCYVGLPGPRMEPELGSWVGLEREKGIKLMGVDATDDLPHEPEYSPTEFNVGLQVLLVGAEVGFDPVEFGDFLLGFFLYDTRKDDR